MNITGVILAAGISSRMGSSNKLLLDYHDHTIIEEVLVQLKESNIREIVIITGHEHEAMVEVLSKHLTPEIKILYNEFYKEGRATSIRCGVEHVKEESDAILFMVGDKPTVNTWLIDKAIDCFQEKQPDLLYVQTHSGRGHPIIFSQRLFPELLALEGDRVGSDLIDTYASRTVILKDNSSQIDIDSDKDYLELLNGN